MINDIAFAERSVEKRMKEEQLAGQAALELLNQGSTSPSASLALVKVNAGGSQGPSVLKSIEKASDQVAELVSKGEVGKGWLKAKIVVNASEGVWTAQADGSDEAYQF